MTANSSKSENELNVRPNKRHLFLDSKRDSRNILDMSFSEDRLVISVYAPVETNLPWHVRLRCALFFLFGLPIPRHYLETSVEVAPLEYGKVLSVATVAYLRNVQLKKHREAEDSLNKNK